MVLFDFCFEAERCYLCYSATDHLILSNTLGQSSGYYTQVDALHPPTSAITSLHANPEEVLQLQLGDIVRNIFVELQVSVRVCCLVVTKAFRRIRLCEVSTSTNDQGTVYMNVPAAPPSNHHGQ